MTHKIYDLIQEQIHYHMQQEAKHSDAGQPEIAIKHKHKGDALVHLREQIRQKQNT